jgi:hypothetical protein
MPYSNYAFYTDRLRRDTGFEDKLTSYCFRRGTANLRQRIGCGSAVKGQNGLPSASVTDASVQ